MTEFTARLDTIQDPTKRLEALMLGALEPIGIPVERALLAEATRDHPTIAPRYRRISEMRLTYVTNILSEAGFEPDQASRRATGLYAAFLGLLHLDPLHPGRIDADLLIGLARRATSTGPGGGHPP